MAERTSGTPYEPSAYTRATIPERARTRRSWCIQGALKSMQCVGRDSPKRNWLSDSPCLCSPPLVVPVSNESNAKILAERKGVYDLQTEWQYRHQLPNHSCTHTCQSTTITQNTPAHNSTSSLSGRQLTTDQIAAPTAKSLG